MWIFCCGMMRSGSTLQFQIASKLVELAGTGKRIEWDKPENFIALKDKYSCYKKRKVFKTHICTGEMVAEFDQNNACGIYVFRDLRDVIVSILTKMKASFDRGFVESYLNTCLHNYARWTGLPGVMVSKYEDMINDLPGEVERIAAHLGIPLNADDYERIASEYTIQKQRERIEQHMREMSTKEHSYEGPVFNQHTLLHIDHINSGKVGQWKRALSSSQITYIEGMASDWLVSHGYELLHDNMKCEEEVT